MNIYARIRKIEESDVFKRFFNTLMGAEYNDDFEATKEWCDYGIDGYLKSRKRVYAVYCPKYPERKDQGQYKSKIKSDIDKLNSAIKENKISLEVQGWYFVTPDDLSVEIKDYINSLTKVNNWSWGALTAQTLAPLFMKHNKIHIDFPEITAGLQYDKVPSVYVKFANNGINKMLEIFNNGTEAIEELEVQIKKEGEEWQQKNKDFFYDFDNPTKVYPHSCFTLKQGERQYVSNVPIKGNFHYKLMGVGVESRKTFNQEGFIEKIIGA